MFQSTILSLVVLRKSGSSGVSIGPGQTLLVRTPRRIVGRDERIVPNVMRTARFIFQIALGWLVVGTTALTIAMWVAGIRGWQGLWHAVGLFFAGFDTGGFAQVIARVRPDLAELLG